MQITTRNFVFVMVAMAGLGAGAATGKANFQSIAAVPAPVAAASQNFEYFPAQYTLNAPHQMNEHIQAF